MPKVEYVPRRFSQKSMALIVTADKIITEYQAQGFELTLRQLYYQFVAREIIPNNQREYKNLGSIINDARLAGFIDWLAIVDRTRGLKGNTHWNSPGQIVKACAQQYQVDKWQTQDTRVEVWIEKDALVGVIDGMCRGMDVPYFSCRGYTSQSEMWVAAQRLLEYLENGQRVEIIHLGDHDPSGIDMTRDIEDRLKMFCRDFEDELTMNRIALTREQVNKLKLPPNPAKLTDSRVDAYIREHGQQSWELDALEPKYISALIGDTIEEFRDSEKWDAMVEIENDQKATLVNVAETLEGMDNGRKKKKR